MPPSIDKAEALKRIDKVLDYVKEGIKKANNKPRLNPYSRNQEEIQMNIALILRLKQTLVELSPRHSEYWSFANSIGPPLHEGLIYQLKGALVSLREDYANDFLKSFNEMVDADLFADILEQAEYLRSQGYVRASAVVAGVALESHLRKLAEKNSIKITKDDGSYMNADTLNGELRKKEVIDKTTNKSITGWLGLRNDAAHPDTKEINEGLIEPMIAGIRVFIQQYPA